MHRLEVCKKRYLLYTTADFKGIFSEIYLRSRDFYIYPS